MDGSRFSSQACCLTVVWKRYRDGALPICWPLLFCIIPTLFAYFLACHLTPFYIFNVFKSCIYYIDNSSTSVGLARACPIYWQVPRLSHDRAWKSRIKSVNPESQVEIYQKLHILLSEWDLDTFQGSMTNFLDLWECKEPDFVEYFKGHYEGWAGNYNFIIVVDYKNMCFMYLYKL